MFTSLPHNKYTKYDKIKKCNSLFIKNRKQASTDIKLKMNLFQKYIFRGVLLESNNAVVTRSSLIES